MTPVWTVSLLSALSALAYALAAVTQERSAAAATSGVIRYVQPKFLLAVILNATGAGLHVLALRQGALAVVQSFSALTLVFALPIGAAVLGRRVTRRQWRGAVAAAAGLTGLLLAADNGVPSEALRDDEIARVATLAATILASLALSRTHSARGRCLRLAAGSGIASGVASALVQTQLLRLDGTPSAGAITIGVVGTAVLIATFAVGGLLFAQTAYRCGLGAPLATLSIVNPVTAAAIGFILLGQGSAMGPGAAAAAITAAALAAHGVVLLAESTPTAREAPGHPTLSA